MTRRRPFLTYFVLCAIPLLLLAGLNYWNGLRSVDSNIGSVVQNDLNAFSAAVDELLNENQKQILQLAIAPGIQRVVTTPFPADDLADPSPADVNSLPHLPDFFESVVLFNGDRDTRWGRERNREWVPCRNKGCPFTRAPDERVWTQQGNTLLDKQGNSSAEREYSVPIHDERGTGIVGAIVGVLDLDNVFQSAARGLETKSGGLMVMAVDRSGKIVYHSDRSLKDLAVNQALPGFSSIANAMNRNESGVGEFKSPSGSYFAAYSPVPQLNLAVAVARNRSAQLSSAHRWGIAGLVLALLFAGGAAFVLERHVGRRSKGIDRVTEDVSAIAKGELDRRIILQSSDDYRSLADNINVVTDQLRAQIAREEETRQFESFMRISAMLTHDLKNAIEGLSLTVGNMERHFDNPQFRADAMRGLTSATDKLKALVARLARPMTSLSGEHKRPTDVDLIPIIQRVVSMTAEPGRGKHSIVTRLPPSLHALADPARVEEVLENLILNALEAMTEQGGTLTIEAGQTTKGLPTFSVSDTGRGMSRTFIETRLFRPFSTTKRTGIGLGLYTCRQVINASGGSIEVDSVEGAGTTFRVVLPSIPHDRRN
jgi:signal transduction histidine kinase